MELHSHKRVIAGFVHPQERTVHAFGDLCAGGVETFNHAAGGGVHLADRLLHSSNDLGTSRRESLGDPIGNCVDLGERPIHRLGKLTAHVGQVIADPSGSNVKMAGNIAFGRLDPLRYCVGGRQLCCQMASGLLEIGLYAFDGFFQLGVEPVA